MSKKKALIDKYSQKYNVPVKLLRTIVESGIARGMNYQQVELGIRLILGHGQEVFTAQDVAVATGMTPEEAKENMEGFYRDLCEQGENPADHGFFKASLD